MTTVRRVQLLGAIVIAVAVAGCGDGRPSMVQVTGIVKLDGKPLEGAAVAFQPVADPKAAYRRPSNGATGADGKFTLTTYEKDDGVPPGKYKVAIVKRELVGQLPANYNDENPGTAVVRYRWVTPRKYSQPEGSGLEAEVTSSELKPETFELTSGGEKPEIEITGPQRRGNEP